MRKIVRKKVPKAIDDQEVSLREMIAQEKPVHNSLLLIGAEDNGGDEPGNDSRQFQMT